MNRNDDEHQAQPTAVTEPLRIWTEATQDSFGDYVTIDTYDDGDITISIELKDSCVEAQAVFTPGDRPGFDRAWQAACRRSPVPALAGHPDIHTWFGLTYSDYLVLPRTLLQSMPDTWQRQFTALLADLGTAFDHVPQAEAYKVEAAEEHEVDSLTPDQLTAAGITVEEGENGDRMFTDPTGREMGSWERVLVVVPDPVPTYNRGRTRIPPHQAPKTSPAI